jgi:hypothetical protein
MEGQSQPGAVYQPVEISQMNAAIDAVCHELGIRSTEFNRRERIAGSVISAWTRGGRLPLDLVRAGLDADRSELA